MGAFSGPPAPSFASPDDTSPEAAEREARVRQAVADFLHSPQATQQPRLPLAGRADSHGPGRPSVYSPGANYDNVARPPSAGERGTAEGGCATGEAPAQPAHAVQLHNTYLVAETADGILIVDQHALHERILFEELMARLEAGPLESQRLLLPVTLSATDREIAAVETHREALARLGIEAGPLGPRTVGIHAFPTVLAKADPAAVLREFLAWVLALDSPPTARQVLESLAHVAACRAAVKAGDPLKAEEIEALLARRQSADLAATCPHGRPTALILSKSDLEKQFGRDYASRPRQAEDDPMPF
jgi:DNA mismatch repair protein MutL